MKHSSFPSRHGLLRGFFQPDLRDEQHQAVWAFHHSDCWRAWFQAGKDGQSNLSTMSFDWIAMKRLLLGKTLRMPYMNPSPHDSGMALEPIKLIESRGISCRHDPIGVNHHRNASIYPNSKESSGQSLEEGSLAIVLVHRPNIVENVSEIIRSLRSEHPKTPIHMFKDSKLGDWPMPNDPYRITLRRSSDMKEGSQWSLLSRKAKIARSEFIMFMTSDQRIISFHQVEAMLGFMREHREVDVVVALLCKHETLCQPAVKFETHRGGLESVPIFQTHTKSQTPYGDNCFRTDMTGNVFILRADLLDTFRWDESLDHFHQIDFFLQLKRAQRVVVTCTNFTANPSNEIMLPLDMQDHDMDLVEGNLYKSASAQSLDSSAQHFLCKWDIEYFTSPEGLTWRLDDRYGHLIKHYPLQMLLTNAVNAKDIERHRVSAEIMYNSLHGTWQRSRILDMQLVKLQPLGSCLFQRYVKFTRKTIRQEWFDGRNRIGHTSLRSFEVNYTDCDYATRYLSIVHDHLVSYDEPIFFVTTVKNSYVYLERLLIQLQRFHNEGKSVS